MGAAEPRLVHFGARDDSDDLCRWTDAGPIPFEGLQSNLYLYRGKDFINAIDSNGRWAFLVRVAFRMFTKAQVGGGDVDPSILIPPGRKRRFTV